MFAPRNAAPAGAVTVWEMRTQAPDVSETIGETEFVIGLPAASRQNT
jgi:hypothetical protein